MTEAEVGFRHTNWQVAEAIGFVAVDLTRGQRLVVHAGRAMDLRGNRLNLVSNRLLKFIQERKLEGLSVALTTISASSIAPAPP